MQRLANGNTLICAGETGRIVEVTTKGAVVWDYLQPHGGEIAAPARGPRGGRGPEGRGPEGRGPGGRGGGGPMSPHGVFRAERYAPDHAGITALLKSKTPTTQPVK